MVKNRIDRLELIKKCSFYCLDDNDIKSRKTGEKFQFGDDTFLEDAVAAIPIPIIIIVDGLEKVI